MWMLWLALALVVAACTDWLAGKWNGRHTRPGTMSIYGLGFAISTILMWKATQG
jgi:hypothetical protein